MSLLLLIKSAAGGSSTGTINLVSGARLLITLGPDLASGARIISTSGSALASGAKIKATLGPSFASGAKIRDGLVAGPSFASGAKIRDGLVAGPSLASGAKIRQAAQTGPAPGSGARILQTFGPSLSSGARVRETQSLSALPSGADLYIAGGSTGTVNLSSGVKIRATLGPALASGAALSGDLVGITDKTLILHPPPNLADPVPAIRTPFIDPVFGTRVQRITDFNWGLAAQSRHEYSRLAMVTADNRYGCFYTGSGYYEIREISTGLRIGSPFSAARGDPEFMTFPNSGNYGFYRSENRIMRVDMSTGVHTTMMTIKRQDGFTDYFSCLTHQEGKADFTGRYFALNGYYDYAGASAGNPCDIIVVDSQTWTVFSREVGTANRGNWLSMTPLGNYVIVGALNVNGFSRDYTILLDRTTLAFIRNIQHEPTHDDLCIGEDGEEYFVYYAVSGVQMSEAGVTHPSLIRVRLSDGSKTFLLRYYDPEIPDPNLGNSTWISGICSYSHPGWVLVSTLRSIAAGPRRFQAECFLLNIHTAEVRRLAHTHSYGPDYWNEPHGTMSWDGSRIYFASNWNQGSSRFEVYEVTAPSGMSFWRETPTLELPSGARLRAETSLALASGAAILGSILQIPTGANLGSVQSVSLATGARITTFEKPLEPGDQKAWSEGLPFIGLDEREDTGEDDFWAGGLPVLPLLLHVQTAIDYADPWLYLYDDTDQYSAGFYEDAFDPSAWASGPGCFGFGVIDSPPADAPIRTSLTPPADNRSLYLRRDFFVRDADALTRAQIWVLRDDAAVVWINGIEVGRVGVTDPITHGKVVSEAIPEGTAYSFEITGPDLAPLRTGWNSISVMGFQAGAASTDLGIGLKLILTYQDVTIDLSSGARLVIQAGPSLPSGAEISSRPTAVDLATGARVRGAAGPSLGTGARIRAALGPGLVAGVKLRLGAQTGPAPEIGVKLRLWAQAGPAVACGARIRRDVGPTNPSGVKVRLEAQPGPLLASGAQITGAGVGTPVATGAKILNRYVTMDLASGMKLRAAIGLALASGVRLLLATGPALASGAKIRLILGPALASGVRLFLASVLGPPLPTGSKLRLEAQAGPSPATGAHVRLDQLGPAAATGSKIRMAPAAVPIDSGAKIRATISTPALSSGAMISGMSIGIVVQDVVYFPMADEVPTEFPMTISEGTVIPIIVTDEIGFEQ